MKLGIIIVACVICVRGEDEDEDNLVVEDRSRSVVQLALELGLFRWVTDLRKAGLADRLTGPDAENVTIFIPYNCAYNNLSQEGKDKLNSTALKEIMQYHIRCCRKIPLSEVHGQDGVNKCERKDGKKVVTVLDSKVVSGDHQVDRGVIHVVDRVLFPPPTGNYIADYILHTPANFSILSSAFAKSDLYDILAGSGRYTLFAPTDNAFAKVGIEELEPFLLNEENVYRILKNHILPRAVYSACLEEGREYSTLGGKTVHISMSGDVIKVNNSIVTQKDLPMTNGVIHIIDSLIMDDFLTSTNANTVTSTTKTASKAIEAPSIIHEQKQVVYMYHYSYTSYKIQKKRTWFHKTLEWTQSYGGTGSTLSKSMKLDVLLYLLVVLIAVTRLW